MSATKTAYAAPTTISMLTDEGLVEVIRQVMNLAKTNHEEADLSDDDKRLFEAILKTKETATLTAETLAMALLGNPPRPAMLIALFVFGARIQRAIDAEAMKVPTGKAN
jgi:hypothetical protein